jgi:hypothetical protein
LREGGESDEGEEGEDVGRGDVGEVPLNQVQREEEGVERGVKKGGTLWRSGCQRTVSCASQGTKYAPNQLLSRTSTLRQHLQPLPVPPFATVDITATPTPRALARSVPKSATPVRKGRRRSHPDRSSLQVIEEAMVGGGEVEDAREVAVASRSTGRGVYALGEREEGDEEGRKNRIKGTKTCDTSPVDHQLLVNVSNNPVKS